MNEIKIVNRAKLGEAECLQRIILALQFQDLSAQGANFTRFADGIMVNVKPAKHGRKIKIVVYQSEV